MTDQQPRESERTARTPEQVLADVDISAMIQQAHDASQVIEGWRNTTPDADWSVFDQTARLGIGQLLKTLYELCEIDLPAMARRVMERDKYITELRELLIDAENYGALYKTERDKLAARVAELEKICNQALTSAEYLRIHDENRKLAAQLLDQERDAKQIIESLSDGRDKLAAQVEELQKQVAKTKHYENPAAKILEHKHLDFKCVEEGCQSLFLEESRKENEALAEALAEALLQIEAHNKSMNYITTDKWIEERRKLLATEPEEAK